MSRPRIAVLLAAGASTRMKSSTSKLLHQVLGKTLIEWAVDLVLASSDQIVIVVGHQREKLEALVREKYPSEKISFAHQVEQKGTADAVRAALEVLSAHKDAQVFIMGADCVLLQTQTLQKLWEAHEIQSAIFSLLTATLLEAGAYGRILRDSRGEINRIKEAKEASAEELEIREINPGFYLIGLKFLREALSHISNTENKTREFYLTDLVSLSRKQGWKMHSLAIRPEEALGVNTQEDLALVEEELRRRINLHWMLQGVRISDPSSVWIEPTVKLAGNVHLLPGVQLSGQTEIAAGSKIGPYAFIRDSRLLEDCEVLAFSDIEGAQLQHSVRVGPFVRIRAGSLLENDVHLGNFVEVKKSHLKSSVKAGHLSYLGDAEIGENTNIGAGTITCNYDGFGKHKTFVGRNVFVGSNTSLVAPVSVGDDAIVGAGSVITADVAKDSLALERALQKEIPQGASKFRDKRRKK